MFDFDTSLSSLDEYEKPPKKIRTIRNRNNAFEMYDDVEFKLRFRFSKANVMELLHAFGHTLEPFTNRNKSISALNQVLVTLRYYATGAFQQLTGDTINVRKSTVCRIIHKVTHEIASLTNMYLHMPRNEELNAVTLDFYNIAGFPRVLGALDCTHIKVASPGEQNSELYRNHKGFFSINVQEIYTAKLKIQHIIARWPGSVHNSTIFNDSPIAAQFENGFYGSSYILGDSGYPCKKFLLTPFLHTQTASEDAYNRAHISTRNAVERCFGVLKRRFPCLYLEMSININHVLPIIIACAVLHNIALSLNDEEPLEEFPFEEDFADASEEFDAASRINENTAVRTALIKTVFAR